MTSDQDQRKDQQKDCDKPWQDLARQASQEQDPEKLLDLVRQLNSALKNQRQEQAEETDTDKERNPPGSGPVNPYSDSNFAEVA